MFWLSVNWTFSRFEINYLERRKVGHPNYLHDGVLSVYRVSDEQNFSVILKKSISEMNDSPDIELEWK
jgi:hypothetical protein